MPKPQEGEFYTRPSFCSIILVSWIIPANFTRKEDNEISTIVKNLVMHRQEAQNLHVCGSNSRAVLTQLVSWINRGTSSETVLSKSADRRKERETDWTQRGHVQGKSEEQKPVMQVCRQPWVRSSTSHRMHFNFPKTGSYYVIGEKKINTVWDDSCTLILASSIWEEQFIVTTIEKAH